MLWLLDVEVATASAKTIVNALQQLEQRVADYKQLHTHSLSAPLTSTDSFGSSFNVGGSSSATAATTDRYCRRLQQQMHEMRREAWTSLNTVSSSENRVAAVRASTDLSRINAVLSSTSEQIRNAQTINVFLAGYTKAGTIITLMIYRVALTASELNLNELCNCYVLQYGCCVFLLLYRQISCYVSVHTRWVTKVFKLLQQLYINYESCWFKTCTS
jgi:hypothetical protein